MGHDNSNQSVIVMEQTPKQYFCFAFFLLRPVKCEDACSLLHPRFEITSCIMAWAPIPIVFTENKVKSVIKWLIMNVCSYTSMFDQPIYYLLFIIQ